MTGVADGAAYGDDAEGCGGNQAEGSILAQNGVRFRGPDLARFVADDAVKTLSVAGWKSCDAAEISGTRQVVVGAAILVEGRSGEPSRAAKCEAVRLGDIGA